MRDILLVAVLLAAPVAVSSRQYQPSPAIDHQDPRLRRLQDFFSRRNYPLHDSAADFLIAADQNNLDWRLLPSISIIESSGGKDYRNNNIFGWDSGHERFSSVQAGIHYVAAHLGKSKLYRNKNTDVKLQTYNPLPEYPHRVKAVMRAMGPKVEPPGLAQD